MSVSKSNPSRQFWAALSRTGKIHAYVNPLEPGTEAMCGTIRVQTSRNTGFEGHGAEPLDKPFPFPTRELAPAGWREPLHRNEPIAPAQSFCRVCLRLTVEDGEVCEETKVLTEGRSKITLTCDRKPAHATPHRDGAKKVEWY